MSKMFTNLASWFSWVRNTSVWQNFLSNYRFWVIWIFSTAVVLWLRDTDPDGGAQLLIQMQTLLWVVVVAGPVYILRRALMDQARSHEALQKAMEHPIGAGLVFLGLCLLTGMLFLSLSARADTLPAGAVKYLPTLKAEIKNHWPDLPLPSVLAAQVEQESLWKLNATLKTSREEGVGLGQFTRAYRADGSLRFDALAETVRLSPALAGWNWNTRYDPVYQLRGVVIKNHFAFKKLRTLVGDDYNALAMTDAAYNGGLGGVFSERRLCAQIAGCNPDKWFGHVELHSTKSRAKWKGYGLSAFDINRQHVKNVMVVRRSKYIHCFN